MSNFSTEEVFAMPGVSMAAIEQIGDQLLGVLYPEALEAPMQVDVLHVVENVLPKHGIHVTPVDPAELKDCEAATDPVGEPGDEIEILVAEPVWEGLLAGGRSANRARVTIMHEVGHAVLHVPVVRRRTASPFRDLLLKRVQRGAIKPYRDPEWQAFALAGCVLAPRRTLEPLVLLGHPVSALADTFGVSEKMLNSHLRRLRLGEDRRLAPTP